MTDRPLELDDIQGDILGGFNTDIQALIGLTAQVDGTVKAAQWLALLAPEVTSVAKVRAERTKMKADPPDPTLTWLGVAVGHDFFYRVAPDVFILDDAFNEGMADRAPSALGDRSDAGTWTVGAVGKPIDALLKIAANCETAVQTRTEALITAARTNGLEVTYQEVGRRLNDNKEHFGFRDGISQPDIIGDQSTTGLSPGNFIFGYPRIPGGVPPNSAIDKRKLTDSGSLLVFRRLLQDPAAFHAFCAAEASRLRVQWPNLQAPQLESLIVGRWPSGAPAHPTVTTDPGVSGDPDNDFDFHGDDDGLVCPFGAHIRKVNPRKGPGDVVDVPRLLRRGIPFENDSVAERGLLFLAYQASITNAFEFVTGHWMNSHNRPGTGDDILIGRQFDARDMPIKGPSGEVTVATNGKQWIHPTGGAYLFAPGRAALARLGEPAPMLAKFAPSLLFARMSSSARQFARRFM